MTAGRSRPQLETLEYVGHTHQFENDQNYKNSANDANEIAARNLALDTVFELQQFRIAHVLHALGDKIG
jgi:hypothetical protein